VVDNYLLSNSKPSFEKRDEYEALDLTELQNRIKKINKKFFNSLNNSESNNKRRLARYLEVLLSEKKFVAKKGKRRYNFLILGLNPERKIIKERIYKRLLDRLNNEDMVGEVKRLNEGGVSFERLESFGLEYRFVSYYLQKKISYQQLIDRLFIAICQFSKKQMSWFRRWERNGAEIVWLEDKEGSGKKIKEFLEK
jgi:tRNA dimethylallyltransferase